jgi:hypothetical protein
MGRDDANDTAVVGIAIIIFMAIMIGFGGTSCAVSQQSPDVVLLPKPPFDIHSNATKDLADPEFRAMVQASAENTTIYLAHDTVVGYIDKVQEWRDIALPYMPGAPE